MSFTQQQLLELANQVADTADVDMSEVSKGGSKLYPEGYALARLCGYTELGKHVGEYSGKVKDPALEFRLTFELYGDGYQEPNGEPSTFRTYDMRLGNNTKSNTKLAFDKLNYLGQAKHFAQLVAANTPVLLKIQIKTSKNNKQYNTVDWGSVLPPFDPVSKQQYNIPATKPENLELFLWDYPQIEAWNKLFIDGTNEDGSSRNFIQNKILSAVNFEGSPLHLLLAGNGAFQDVQPEPAPTPQVTPVKAPKAAVKKATVAPPSQFETPVISTTALPSIPAFPKLPKV